MTRYLKLGLGFAITGIAVWLIGRKLDFGSVIRITADASPALMLASLGALALGYSARILRWWMMLRVMNPDLRPVSAVRPFLVSIALNNVLPFRAGDFARAFGFRSELGDTPAAQVLGTLLLERLLDLIALLVIFFLGLRGLAVTNTLAAVRATAVWLTAAALGGLIITIVAPVYVRRLASAVLKIPRLLAMVDQVLDALAVLRRPGTGTLLVVLTFAAWLLEGSMYAILARAVHAGASSGAALFALALGNLATLIPSSPGYVGTFDYFVISAFDSYGVTQNEAGALALLIHAFLWFPITLAGGLFYWIRPLPAQTEHAAELQLK